MARIRSIKPDFWTDGKVARLTPNAALFFIALWNFADDAGYFTLDTLELSMKMGRWRSQEVFKLLRTLVDAGLVLCSRGVGVGLVVGWEHQRIDKPRPSKWQGSEIAWDSPDQFVESSANVRRKDRIGKDRIGEDRISSEGGERPAPSTPELLPAPVQKPPKEKAPTGPTWEAYAEAYSRRYHVAPTRNATVNGQLANFVKRLGAEEAPQVAAFFLTHNGSYYVQTMHPVGVMLRDAEKLRTEWATGTKMLASKAKEIERTQHNLDAWDFAAAALEARKGETHES